VQAPAAVTPPKTEAPSRYPSVVFLLDVSDSMLDKSPGKQISHLDEAKNAIISVIQGMSPETRVQMWIFSTRMAQVALKGTPPRAFTPVGDAKQRDELIAKIREIRTGGGTDLYQSVIKTLQIFADPRDQLAYRSGQRFPVLVIVSDGEDWGKSGVTLEQATAAERKLPLVTVSAVGFTVGKDDPWFKTLCGLATRENGCATADDQAQLAAMLESFYRPPAIAANTPGK
jgi:Mg-chelatase subunit ChlD